MNRLEGVWMSKYLGFGFNELWDFLRGVAPFVVASGFAACGAESLESGHGGAAGAGGSDVAVVDSNDDDSVITNEVPRPQVGDESSFVMAPKAATACTSDSQCATGFCTDGFCCDSRCDNGCMACSATKKGSGFDGVCGSIAYDTDPDNDCPYGACDGKNQCKNYNGITCTVAAECLSNYCVDGFCCNNTCMLSCQACSAAKKGSGTNGVCGAIAIGTDPDNECNPGECTGSFSCNALPQPQKDNGQACTSAAMCKSGYCTDGVCCDVDCTGSCQACTAVKRGSGSDGTCGPIPYDKDPDNECWGGACNGQSACKQYNGIPCTDATQCLSNYCVDGFCCGNQCTQFCYACSAGKKGQGLDGVCGPIASGRDLDNECNPGECNGSGACNQSQVLLANGASCTSGGQCTSGHCVDDLCCDTACNGLCQACSATKKGSGTNGTCGPIANDKDPDNECAAGACSGSGTCQFYNGVACAQATECLSNYCVDGVCCGNQCTDTCKACTAAKKGSGVDGVCGLIANDKDPDNECAAGACSGNGTCQFYNGVPCAQTSECLSSYCVDGVCCGNQCTDTCKACSAAKKGSGLDGVCGNIASDTDPDDECPLGKCDGAGVCTALVANGTQCSNDAQCGSGHCVDGVCCDTACTGVCVACHLPGSVGTCSPIATGQSDPTGTPACSKVCDGNGGCVRNAGETCNGGSDCLSRICTKGVCQGPTTVQGPLVWATLADTSNLISGYQTSVQIEQISASITPGGPILIDGLAPDSTGRNLILDGSFTSRGYPAFYASDLMYASGYSYWRRLGRGGVAAWWQMRPNYQCFGGWPGHNGAGEAKVILGSNDLGQYGAIVQTCNSSIDFGDGVLSGGTFLVRYKDGVGLDLKMAAPSNLADPVVLGPNGELYSLSNPTSAALNFVKFNADGTQAWTKTVTGTISGGQYDIDADGNIIISFAFMGTVYWGAGPLIATTGYELGLVKLNPAGGVIWQRRFPATIAGSRMVRAGSRDIALSGIPMNPGVDIGSGELTSSFVAKFDSAGNLKWTATGINTTALAADPSGGVYVATYVGGGGIGPWNISFTGRGIAMAKFKECSGPSGCKTYGASCTSDSECGSGACADGVCCDNACNGTCQACTAAKKGYGDDGKCELVGAGNDPDNDCPTGACNAAGKCVADLGASCALVTDCASGFCVDGICCNEACSGVCRACTAALKGSGTDGTCASIAAGTDPGNECGGGNCSGAATCAMAGNGIVCTANDQCASGHCADGICCDTACTETCNACTAAKKGNGLDGTCGPIANDTDPDNECTNGSCDGASACKFSNATVCSGDGDCLSGHCVDGFCCNDPCNGTCVACSAAKKGSGQNGVCGNIAKGTDPDAECGSVACSGAGSCLEANGTACSLAAQCQSNHCQDGVCCDSACNGTCMACSAAKKGQGVDGTCETIISGMDPDDECNGSTCDGNGVCMAIPCTTGSDCPTGFCTNGFCAGNIVDLDVNQYRSCAVFLDGRVKCWGSYAGLGLNSTNIGDNANEMGANLPFLPMGTGRVVQKVSTGYRFQCALTTLGEVVCWGYNDWAQLGRGDKSVPDTYSELGDNLLAVNLGTGKTAVQLAVGGLHACAVLNDGTLKCWGYNVYGQLGYGDTNKRGWYATEMGDALPAVDLGTGRTAIAVAVEEYNTCALLDNGGVKCWGYGAGVLGQGDTITRGDNSGEMGDALPTINLGTGKTAVEISLGRGHACARLNDQSLKCWGNNQYGALGLGTTDTRGDQPGEMGDNLPAIDLGTGRVATKVNAAEWFTCALLDDGNLKCWGAGAPAAENGTWSNLGDQPGEMGDNLAPVNLGTGKKAIRFSSRWAHTCALLNDNTVKCWGYNVSGELGLGNTTSTPATGDTLPVVPLY